MKMLATLAALLLGTTAAFAGPFGLPDHQQDGFRDTGCDAAAQKPITNADGEILYWNNETCPGVGAGAIPAEFIAAFVEPRGGETEASLD